MIPKNESGHPISHTFTNSIPTSQCMVCHMHPGTNMVAQLSRADLVGQRNRRREDVSRDAARTVSAAQARGD